MSNLKYPIGTKIKIPKTKQGSTTLCTYARQAIEDGRDYLYYTGIVSTSRGHKHCVSINPRSNFISNYYHEDEIIAYDESPFKKQRTIKRSDIVELMLTTNKRIDTMTHNDCKQILKTYIENNI